MNVDCGRWRTSLVRGRVLTAGLVLLAAGCAVLGLGFRSHKIAAADLASATGAGFEGFSLSPISTDHSISLEQARSLFAGLPLIFEPNIGQRNLDPADSRARFVAHGSGYSLFLGSQGAILSLVSTDQPMSRRRSSRSSRVESVQMKLAGANPHLQLQAAEPLPGKSNYLIGDDPSKWHTGVPQFARVRYESVYPGIDLVFYGNQGHLEYDFQVAPGADPAKAELEFDGARQLELQDGALVLHSGSGSVRLEAPRVYQEVAGAKQPVEGKFVLRGTNRAGFAIGSYDRSRELIIDPILTFSTYFGGSGDELSTTVAVDGALNIYLTGSTTSPDLPATPGSFQSALAGAGPNVYVAKISPPLPNPSLVYVTYLGGNGSDIPVGIKADGGYHAFIAGTTTSTNFPTSSNAYQNAPAAGSTGTSHVFVTELSTAGSSLAYSSYLSGNGTDVASGMTIDALGDLFVTGTTTSTNTGSQSVQFPASSLPETVAYQANPKGPIQFFVTKVNTGSTRQGSIAYSTYFGGGTFSTTTPTAVGGGIAVDTSNNVYFSGTTNYTYTGCAGCSATDFPILNAFQPCLDQPPPTVIVNPATCTYTTGAANFSDAFVAKLNLNPNTPPGQQLVWSTYVGGTGDDSSTGVGLDPGAANVFLVGTTNSPDIPIGIATLSRSASFQQCLDAPGATPTGTPAKCPAPATTPFPADAFVARLTNPTTTTGALPTNVVLNYFSYLGGSSNENGLAITVDSASGALVTGWTTSSDFPVAPPANSIQSVYGGSQDAFIARINTAAVIGQTTTASWASYFGGSGTDSGTGIALDANQDTYLAGSTNSPNLQVGKPLPASLGGGYKGGYDAFVTHLGTAVSLSIQGSLALGTNQTFISAGNPATFTYIVTNNGPDLATNITLSDNLNPALTGVPLTFNSAATSSGTCGGVSAGAIVSCILPSLQSGSTATVTIVVTPTANANGNQATFNGGTVQVMTSGNIVLAQTSVPAVMSDFSMTVSPTNNSVPVAGDTATYQVQLTPHPLYTSAIAISCSNLPTQVGCNVSPSSSITVESTSGATATLSLTTTARPLPNPVTGHLIRGYYGIWLAIPGLSLLFVSLGGNRRPRRIAGIMMLCTILAMLLLTPACTQMNQQPPASGTPPGNYTITVTAASGSDSKSQTINLVVP